MHVLIVHAHPEPASFNAALTRHGADALRRAGHDVTVSDLHAEGFNPVAGRHDFTTVADPALFHYQTEQAHAARNAGFCPEITREQTRVAAADLLVLQFPLWWGGPPGLLKGWFERVMAYGFGYVDGARFASGLFRGRRAILSVTTGGPAARFSAGDVYGPIDDVLYPVRHLMLEYMGYEVEPAFVSYAAPRVETAERARMLADWSARLLESAARPVTRIDTTAQRDGTPEAAWSMKR